MNAMLTGIALRRSNLRVRPLTHAADLPTSKLEAAAIAHWPSCAKVMVELSPCDGSPIRKVNLQVSIGALVYERTHWVARFWEEDAPLGVKPVEWFLVSRWRLRSAEDTLDLLRRRPDLVTRLDR
jgi:hypothetical protein